MCDRIGILIRLIARRRGLISPAPGTPMKEDFLRYFYAGVWNHLAEEQKSIEGGLKEIGYDMGKRMMIIRNFRPEASIEALLYRIVFILLPSFYETERMLEKSSSEKNTFLVTENRPLMNRCISLPAEYASFTCDAVFAGVIESILRASGFMADVTAHNVPSPGLPKKIVYVVKLACEEEEIIEL